MTDKANTTNAHIIASAIEAVSAALGVGITAVTAQSWTSRHFSGARLTLDLDREAPADIERIDYLAGAALIADVHQSAPRRLRVLAVAP